MALLPRALLSRRVAFLAERGGDLGSEGAGGGGGHVVAVAGHQDVAVHGRAHRLVAEQIHGVHEGSSTGRHGVAFQGLQGRAIRVGTVHGAAVRVLQVF